MTLRDETQSASGPWSLPESFSVDEHRQTGRCTDRRLNSRVTFHASLVGKSYPHRPDGGVVVRCALPADERWRQRALLTTSRDPSPLQKIKRALIVVNHRPNLVKRLSCLLVTSTIGLPVVVGLAGPAFAAAAANDNFVNAQSIAGISGSISGSLVDASLEVGEPQHYSAWDDDPVASIWYTWTAPETGVAEFSANWVVDIYKGSSLGSLQLVDVACDSSDRGYSDGCKKAHVTEGDVYRISVAGAQANSALTWRLFTVPANDAFSQAIVLNGLEASLPTIEEGGHLATAQTGEPQHRVGTQPLHSIWYRWTAKWNADVTIDVVAGGYVDGCTSPTALAIYRGSTLTALTGVASAQTGFGCDSPQVNFIATAGTTYHIAIDSNYADSDAGRVSGYLQAAPICRIGGTMGNDTLVGTPGNDVLCGLEGDDVIKGQGGDDLIMGGAGIDAANYADAATGVIANLGAGTATGHGTDTLQDVENLIGSPFDDKLDGSSDVNTLNGGAGNDGLWGQAGDDAILGADGNDTTGGGLGNDHVNGGAGTDTAHFGKAATVTVNLATSSATGEGTDVLSLMENVTGSPGADKLTGTEGLNVLQGGGGNDTILGQGGNDQLLGAAGNDSLTGGVGTDRCDGGSGTDTAATCETKVAVP